MSMAAMQAMAPAHGDLVITFVVGVLLVICPDPSTGVEPSLGFGLLPRLQRVVPRRGSCSLLLHEEEGNEYQASSVRMKGLKLL